MNQFEDPAEERVPAVAGLQKNSQINLTVNPCRRDWGGFKTRPYSDFPHANNLLFSIELLEWGSQGPFPNELPT